MATTARATVLGVFTSREQAEQAVEELHQAGFGYDDIGFVTRDEKGDRPTMIPGFVPGVGTGTAAAAAPGVAPIAASPTPLSDTEPEVVNTSDIPVETTNETTNRIAAGATGGGVVGGLLGAAATLLIPGIGPITATGVLVGVLTGLLAGSVAGGLIGALTSMGLSEEEASYYHNEVAAGRILVTVNAPGRQEEARTILRHSGATEMQTRASSSDEPASLPDDNPTPTRPAPIEPASAENTTPEHETLAPGPWQQQRQQPPEQPMR